MQSGEATAAAQVRAKRRRWLRVVAALALPACAAAAAAAWVSLIKDGIHDPASPAVKQLQEPSEALSVLPRDTAGNLVRWVEAIDRGHIRPRANLSGEKQLEVRDTDVMMKRTGEMPMVKFPHRVHTQWLDCSSCHDAMFKREAGATKVNMFMILNGEKCGLCHGAVAFPLTECHRCHSVPRS